MFKQLFVRTCCYCLLTLIFTGLFLDSAWSFSATFYLHFRNIDVLGDTVSITVAGERGQYQKFREILIPGISNEVVEIGKEGYFQIGENVKACIKNHDLGKKSDIYCDSDRLDNNGTVDLYLNVPQK